MKLMIDIETLDTKISAVMFAIGLAWFDEEKIITSEQINININSLKKLNRTISQQTLKFWATMPGIFQDQMENGQSIYGVLVYLDHKLNLPPYKVSEIWANGPSFDLAILKSYYEQLEMEVPWKHSMERDYRTLKNLPGFTEDAEHGGDHIAIEDAIFQAKNVINYFKNH